MIYTVAFDLSKMPGLKGSLGTMTMRREFCCGVETVETVPVFVVAPPKAKKS